MSATAVLPPLNLREPDISSIYPNHLCVMECFPPQTDSDKENHLTQKIGLDKETAKAYLGIVNNYEQKIQAAEQEYIRVICSDSHPHDPSGRMEHRIITAYYKRIHDYNEAMDEAKQQLTQLSQTSGYPIWE